MIIIRHACNVGTPVWNYNSGRVWSHDKEHIVQIGVFGCPDQNLEFCTWIRAWLELLAARSWWLYSLILTIPSGRLLLKSALVSSQQVPLHLATVWWKLQAWFLLSSTAQDLNLHLLLALSASFSLGHIEVLSQDDDPVTCLEVERVSGLRS